MDAWVLFPSFTTCTSDNLKALTEGVVLYSFVGVTGYGKDFAFNWGFEVYSVDCFLEDGYEARI